MTLVIYALVALSAVVCAGAYCLARLSETERALERDLDPPIYHAASWTFDVDPSQYRAPERAS